MVNELINPYVHKINNRSLKLTLSQLKTFRRLMKFCYQQKTFRYRQ